MKTRFILFLFLVAGPLMSYAQPRYDIGFQGGALVSTMPGFSNAGMTKLSGTGGIIFTRRDRFKNHLQMEINYIRKGALRKPEADNPDKISLSLHYVEIPLYYRLNAFKASRKGRGGIDFGLSYAYLLSPQLRRNGDKIEFNPIWSDKYDLSAMAGLFYSVNSHVIISAKYAFSINPILRRNIIPDDIASFNSQQTHNHMFQVNIAFFIRGRYY
jgi:hypothetical protein